MFVPVAEKLLNMNLALAKLVAQNVANLVKSNTETFVFCVEVLPALSKPFYGKIL